MQGLQVGFAKRTEMRVRAGNLIFPTRQACAAIGPAAGAGGLFGGGTGSSISAFSAIITSVGEINLLQTLVYRTTELVVSTAFLSEYSADFFSSSRGPGEGKGLVSSMDDTLEVLWQNYLDDVRMDVEEFKQLLGCYNLHRSEEADRYWFFDDSWGAPLYVFLYSCQMVHSYINYVEYNAGGGSCQGLSGFAETLLEGNEATNDAHERCYLTINFRNADDRYSKLRDECFTVRDCTKFNFGSGCEGNDWEIPIRLFNDSPWNCWSADGVSGCGAPANGCEDADGFSVRAIGSDFNVTFHPILLAWDGFVVDWVMYMARLAWDYAQYQTSRNASSALRSLDAATKFARYGLRIIADQSSVLIHEIGHSYLGGGHCEFNCCFDRAGKNFLCHVRGRLGLPVQRYKPDLVSSLGTYDDWEATDSFYGDGTNSCDDDGSNWYGWSCDVKRKGVVGQHAEFCSSDCTHTSTTDCQPSTGSTGRGGVDPGIITARPCFRVVNGVLMSVPCDDPGEIDPPEDPGVIDWIWP